MRGGATRHHCEPALTGGIFAAITTTLFIFTPTTTRAGVLVDIDKATQQMTVSVDGEQRYIWQVSTGGRGYATPSGTYNALRLVKEHYSKEWDNAPMPHSIFFTPRGHAIHGSYQTKHLGSAVSHGCVRLAPDNAATLFALVKENGLSSTEIVLTGEAPALIARRPAQRQAARRSRNVQQHSSYAGRSRDQRRYQQYARQPRYDTPAYGHLYGQPNYGSWQYPSYLPSFRY
jgi:L,D-transpeptidase catalytic domain